MNPLSLIGGPPLILLARPNWARTVSLAAEVPVAVESSPSQRETRTAFARSLRWTIRFTATVRDAELSALQGALLDFTTERVAVPFWPALMAWENRSACPLESGLKLAIGQGGAWEVYTDTEPVWATAGDWFLPLLVGDLTRRQLKFRTPTAADFDVELVEAGDLTWAVTPKTVTLPVGPAVSGRDIDPVVWPFAVEWMDPAESVSVDLDRDPLGFGRDPVTKYYPQPHVAEGDAVVTTRNVAELGTLLTAWQRTITQSFWMVAPRAAVRLTADVTAGATTIPVLSTDALRVGDWLAVVGPRGELGSTVQVAGLSSTTITVSSAPELRLACDLLVPLRLVRWRQPRIEIECQGPAARTRLAVREVPAELDPAADETVGTTLGSLPEYCYLYEFKQRLESTEVVQRLTSYEQDILALGVTWTAAQITHGDIIQSLNLERDQVEITHAWDAVAMLRDVIGLRADAPVEVKIYRAELGFGVVEVNTVAVGLLAQETRVPAVQVDTMGVTVIGLESVRNIELNTLAAAVIGSETMPQSIAVDTLGAAIIGHQILQQDVELSTLGLSIVGQQTLADAIALDSLSILVIGQTTI